MRHQNTFLKKAENGKSALARLTRLALLCALLCALLPVGAFAACEEGSSGSASDYVTEEVLSDQASRVVATGLNYSNYNGAKNYKAGSRYKMVVGAEATYNGHKYSEPYYQAETNAGSWYYFEWQNTVTFDDEKDDLWVVVYFTDKDHNVCWTSPCTYINRCIRYCLDYDSEKKHYGGNAGEINAFFMQMPSACERVVGISIVKDATGPWAASYMRVGKASGDPRSSSVVKYSDAIKYRDFKGEWVGAWAKNQTPGEDMSSALNFDREYGVTFLLTGDGRGTIGGSTERTYYMYELVTGSKGLNGKDAVLTLNYTDYLGVKWDLATSVSEGYNAANPDTDALKQGGTLSMKLRDWSAVDVRSMQCAAINVTHNLYDESALDTALLPHTATHVLFAASGDIKRINSINVDLGGGKMDVASIRLIEPDGKNWLGETYWNGSYSRERLREFDGKLRAEMHPNSYTVNSRATFSTTDPAQKLRLTVYEPGAGPAFNTKSSMVGVSIQLADIYNAGVDELMAHDGEGGNFWSNLDPYVEECFTLELQYKDTKNAIRQVEVPVLTTYICQLVFQDAITEKKLSDIVANTDINPQILIELLAASNPKKNWISGLMRQDDNVALALRLSEFKELVSLQFTYGTKPAGMTYTTTSRTEKDGCDKKTVVTDNVRRINTDKDVIAVENICFYTNVTTGNFSNSFDGKNLGVQFTTSLTPQYSYSAVSRNGVRFAKGGALNLTVGKGNFVPGKPTAREKVERYLVRFETTNVNLAETKDAVNYTISYITSDDTKRTTANASMVTACANYYGISALDAPMDEQYVKHMGRGKINEFTVELSGVKSFESITLTLQGKDEWQFKNIEILKLDSLSARYTKDGRTDSGIYWMRDASGARMAYARKSIMLSGNNSTRTINFTAFDKNGEPIKEQEQEKNESYMTTLPEELSYKDALKDLGLSVPKYTYSVDVTVADVQDAGSSNYFYFQLCFENGESGVVLANQQLASDSFRQGTTESFHIKTAQNYGKLTSVRVICDNVTSTSDVFDKLNIDQIAVTLAGKSGVSRSWIVERVGWIDITYTDEGENEIINEFGSAEADGKVKNIEIVKEFEVTRVATAVDLLFSVKTGNVLGGPSLSHSAVLLKAFASLAGAALTGGTNVDGETVIDSALQEFFSNSSINAMLVYYDSEGAEKTLEFNLSEKIKAYNDTEKVSTLFRPNHMDRFLLSLTDVSSIQAIYLSTAENGYWLMDEMSIQQVSGVGDVYISEELKGEFYRDVDKAVDLCTSTNDSPVEVSAEQIAVTFTENSIAVNGQSEEVNNWDTTISSIPNTRNDTFNVYLFPGVSLGQQTKFNTGHPGVHITVKFGTVFGGRPVESGFDLTQYQTLSDGTTVLYAEKLDLKNFSTLNSIMVSSKSANGEQPYIGKMIVEHVRSGVMVGTYCIDYGGAYLGNGNPDIPPSMNVQVAPMHQTMQLQVAPGQAAALKSKTSDILVALRYVSALDASGKMVYRSPYVYLTQANITSLSYGKSVTVPFAVGNVGRVVGMSIISSGPNVRFERALIANYDGVSGDNGVLLNACGIKQEFVSSSMRTDLMANNTETVVPVTFTFATGDEATYAGAGAQGRIDMTVGYVNADGAERTVEVADIASYLPAGETFEAGTTKSISLLLPDVDYVKSVELAADDDWFLTSITTTSAPLGGTPLTATKSVNNHTSRDASLKVTVTPTSKGGTADGNEIRSFTVSGSANGAGTVASAMVNSAKKAGEITVNAYAGDTVTFKPSISVIGAPDATWKWYGASDLFVSADNASATFTVPANTAANSAFDLGSVQCNGNRELTVSIRVNVIAKPEPPKQESTSGGESANNTSGTESSSGTP